ncbi:hypothetical protein C8R46DRAFT_1052953 [Mycena filopes]|nr:hypothetical protein C8R46DRAFT_1052953 [Mycena filopes]
MATPTSLVPESSPVEFLSNATTSTTSTTATGTGFTAADAQSALAGLSLGLGLLVGLLFATGIYYYRRRRAEKTGRGIPDDLVRQKDGEALLGYQNAEKGGAPPPNTYAGRAPVPPRILDWVQRTRMMSISSKASSWFPTIEDSSSTIARTHSTSTVVRTPSVASSRSMYSQASAFPNRPSEDNSHEFEGISRAAGLVYDR